MKYYTIDEAVKMETPTKKGYKAILIKDYLNNLAHYEFVKDDITIEIEQLKKNLADTDYKAIKYGEGVLSYEEYAETKQQRQSWRDRINELEVIISESDNQ